jgi:hypothetical protein
MKTFQQFCEEKALQEAMAAPDMGPPDAYQASAAYVQSFDNSQTGKDLAALMRKYTHGSEATAKDITQALQDVGHRIFQLQNIEQQGGKLTPAQQKELEGTKDMFSQLYDMQYKALMKQDQQQTGQKLSQPSYQSGQTNSLGEKPASLSSILSKYAK